MLWSINVHLGLLQSDVEFLWWGGVGGVCKVIFMSNPTVVLRLRLCCVVVGVVTIINYYLGYSFRSLLTFYDEKVV